MKDRIKHLSWLPLIIISIFIFKYIDRLSVVMDNLKYVANILTPFIWAFVFAYLLNPSMVFFENRFKMKRGFAILVVYMLVLGVIVISLTFLIPGLVENLDDLIKILPDYISETEDYIVKFIDDNKLFDQFGISGLEFNNLKDIMGKIGLYTNVFFSKFLGTVLSFTSGILKIIIGIIISIYLLKDKEYFKIGSKKIIYYFINKESADKIISLGDEMNTMFSKYLIGKLIDSLIIGLLCFIGMVLLKAPFALLFSIIVGITNMIPYFGPFIGAVPVVSITLFYSPVKAFWVLLFILALQQLDGYVIGPKILGDSVGLSPFWIILAIIIGGGFFGIIGMLIGVPVLAVLKNQFSRVINRKLERNNIEIR